MTVHDLGPDWIKLKYTSATRQKTALYPCLASGVVTPGTEPDVVVRSGSPQTATTVITGLIDVVSWLFHTTDSFDSFEFYHKDTPTSAPTLIFTAPLGLPGTSSLADVLYTEFVVSWKTPSPGNLKLYFMETIVVADSRHSLPNPDDPNITAFVDFMLGVNGWIRGRNGELPLAGIRYTSKQNDFYRRKYKL